MKYDIRTDIHLTVPDIDRTGASYMAVLVKSSVGDHYCAYAALVQLSAKPHHKMYTKARELKAQRVAALGAKLTFEQARAYFPAIKQSQYDRGM